MDVVVDADVDADVDVDVDADDILFIYWQTRPIFSYYKLDFIFFSFQYLSYRKRSSKRNPKNLESKTKLSFQSFPLG